MPNNFKKPTMKMYLVWNLTNASYGFEFLGLYNTEANATKAYKRHMRKLYGTTSESKLEEIWESSDDGCVDNWRIDEITIND